MVQAAGGRILLLFLLEITLHSSTQDLLLAHPLNTAIYQPCRYTAEPPVSDKHASRPISPILWRPNTSLSWQHDSIC